jgi:Fic family protein
MARLEGHRPNHSIKLYCELNKVVRDTANRDLNDLLKEGILKRSGKGRAAHYVSDIG